jgi:dCTP diphosphatase
VHSPDLQTLLLAIRAFAEERHWQDFHTPKNLSMALSVEASELMEHFQWLTPEQSANPDADKLRAVAEEMADVLIYLIRMADVLNVDLIEAAWMKTRANAEKYPVERSRGSADKYTIHMKPEKP